MYITKEANTKKIPNIFNCLPFNCHKVNVIDFQYWHQRFSNNEPLCYKNSRGVPPYSCTRLTGSNLHKQNSELHSLDFRTNVFRMVFSFKPDAKGVACQVCKLLQKTVSKLFEVLFISTAQQFFKIIFINIFQNQNETTYKTKLQQK